MTGFRPGATDIYVSMSLQSEAVGRESKKGWKYYTATRDQEHAVSLQAIWLDIDVKGNGGYASSNEAKQSIQSFCKAVNLPLPNVLVSTGPERGFHVYWTFTNAVTVADWQPLANALRNAATTHELKFDAGVTIDCARMLRLPGTLNHKVNPPVPVQLAYAEAPYDFDQIKAILAPYTTPIIAASSTHNVILHPRTKNLVEGLIARPFNEAALLNDELAGGIGQPLGTQVVSKDALVKECRFMMAAALTKGSQFLEPQWWDSIQLAVHTFEGEEFAHEISCGHEGYSHDATEAKYQRAVELHIGKDHGWLSCRKINERGASECAGCPHFARIQEGKSPIHFAREASKVAATGNTALFLPNGYCVSNEGVVQQEVEGEAGEGEVAETYMVEVIGSSPVLEGTYEPETAIINIKIKTPFGTRTVRVSPDMYADTRKFVTEFAKAGVMLEDTGATIRAKKFVMAWNKVLQGTKDRWVQNHGYGWVTADGEYTGFSYDDRAFMSNGEEKSTTIVDRKLADVYTPAGRLEKWVHAAKLITDQKRPGLDAILASAFASPLIEHAVVEGAVLSVYSQESGIGKSTALKVAQAVWGHGKMAMQQLDDTANSALKKLGILRHLPMMWDELKTEDDFAKFVRLVFQVASGLEKSRLNSNADFRARGSWATLVVVASNDSLTPKIEEAQRTSLAGQLRCFEYELRPALPGSPGQISLVDMGSAVNALHLNYGHAGLTYARFLGRSAKRVASEVQAQEKRIIADLSLAQEVRFYASTVATLIQGAIYANELGLTEIDVDTMREFLYDATRALLAAQANSSANMANHENLQSVLAGFLKDMKQRHTIITDVMFVHKGTNTVNPTVKFVGNNFDKCAVHISALPTTGHTPRMRISERDLRNWLAKNAEAVTVRKLCMAFGGKRSTASLAAGTPYGCPNENVWEFDLTDPRMEEMDILGKKHVEQEANKPGSNVVPLKQ